MEQTFNMFQFKFTEQTEISFHRQIQQITFTLRVRRGKNHLQ